MKKLFIPFIIIVLIFSSCAEAVPDPPPAATAPTSPDVSTASPPPITSAETVSADESEFTDRGLLLSSEDIFSDPLAERFGISDAPELFKTLTENEDVKNLKLYDFTADDFDLDGVQEAFAVVGEYNGYHIDGCIYFITQNGCEKINDEPYDLREADEPVIDLGDRKLYRVWNVFVTGRCAYVYGVKDGGWYEHEISMRGQDLERVGDSYDFTIVNGSDYDCGVELDSMIYTGHTWKTYYLYWNGEEFREYGGIEITEEQFSGLEGAREILDAVLGSAWRITGILYRSNGIIDVNLAWRRNEYCEDYCYIELRLKDGAIEYVSDSDDEDLISRHSMPGNMHPAFLEDIADYPESFPE